ncbi:SagB/ThcOx family dehydrogenase [Pectinatus brassicae]|uniref:SagB-type dehydrogenase family enzyme n=1 Tax=Pectinatus brassicae TaxID=862415 RepID=A0A840UTN5_9FIRM|nr:SagB/ThcOx family dehydrogenase [Pectinatus brassicae]MBB5336323.1 SagB-type dehydrogenase family enzyme [Pectinatus brassicae]
MNRAAQEFLQESSWESGQTVEKINKPNVQLSFDRSKKMIILPEPELLQDHEVNFLELIELRSTLRQYSDIPLSLKELSYLLWCSQGVKAANENMTLRTVPSAGACHSLETYIIMNNVEGLEAGMYRFLAIEHALIPLEINKDDIIGCFSTFRVVENSAVSFLWSTVIERLSYKFGSRAYRYAFLDAGHVCENLYLAAQTIEAGVCPLGAFADKKINSLMNFVEEKQFMIYGAAVGKI